MDPRMPRGKRRSRYLKLAAEEVDQPQQKQINYEEYYFNKVSSVIQLHTMQSEDDDWTCPNELLIPPYKGLNYVDILRIGNHIMMRDRFIHNKLWDVLVDYNERGWDYILEQQKPIVVKKVDKMFEDILKIKSRILGHECAVFFGKTLKDLEVKIRQQIQNISDSINRRMLYDIQNEIRKKLENEKGILCEILDEKFDSESKKVNEYYDLLSNNEKVRVFSLINNAKYKRNQIIEILKKQFEAEKLTSTMYIMSTQRRKCKIKQFLLQNLHTSEVLESLNEIKDQEKTQQEYKLKKNLLEFEVGHHENKLKNILKLFGRLISFTFKLLPEQSNFLLDFQKIFLSQMNEFQKNPILPQKILISDENLNKYEWPKTEIATDLPCPNEPFIIEGDLGEPEPEPSKYGSRSTLPEDEELPYMRLNRQFIYAKCDTFEDVKKITEKCKNNFSCTCLERHNQLQSETPEYSVSKSDKSDLHPSTSAFHSNIFHEKVPLPQMNLEDPMRLEDCPMKCNDAIFKHLWFPQLNEYLDYDEAKYKRVVAMLQNIKEKSPAVWIDMEDLFYHEPYMPTTERWHNVETQCSSHDTFYSKYLICPCVKTVQKIKDKHLCKKIPVQEKSEILAKRKESLNKLFHADSRLLNIMLNDEAYNIFK